ncbi:LRR receptor-like serine/threonine-protein kinase EFR [Solanum tuberosum]|uniref:LRR receptor-like serine/threonine-protein kinase EFR n=1 Tax=Solanum tuberosum TaxID=4113 RepID=UPI00073A1899|nr:PREDICTED: LRR receptor-like serine/threonine-protein kinase EFR [Solanum tuberosum]
MWYQIPKSNSLESERQEIPSELGSLSKLTKLHLGSNNLSGSFPASLGNLTYLQELKLSYNQLKGKLPDSLSQMRSLTLIDLSVNQLCEFPLPLYNLSSLKGIGLSYNYFLGNLRSNIGDAFPKAEKINWGMNSFTGTFPDSFANASNLQILDLPGNNFTGNVPASLGKVKNLRWLNVNGNQLGSDELHQFPGQLQQPTVLAFGPQPLWRHVSKISNQPVHPIDRWDRIGFEGTYPKKLQTS